MLYNRDEESEIPFLQIPRPKNGLGMEDGFFQCENISNPVVLAYCTSPCGTPNWTRNDKSIPFRATAPAFCTGGSEKSGIAFLQIPRLPPWGFARNDRLFSFQAEKVHFHSESRCFTIGMRNLKFLSFRFLTYPLGAVFGMGLKVKKCC